MTPSLEQAARQALEGRTEQAEKPALWAMWHKDKGWVAGPYGLSREAFLQEITKAAIEEGASIDMLYAKGWEVRPMYGAPQPAPQPLTDEEIADIYADNQINPMRFARAIERAHGIGTAKRPAAPTSPTT